MSTKKSANSAAPVTDARTVRLCELDHDPISIAGHEGRLTKLDDLKASLPALGQLQSLKVRPAQVAAGAEGARQLAGGSVLYWVTAGNRRLATLKALREESAAVQGVLVTDDFPVHVVFSDQSDDDAKQAMVAENVQRLAPTPIEEARDFAEMVKVSSVKAIALQFGVKLRYVEQRLKLASLHLDVQAALETGRITLEAAEAFTLEQDPERQAAYLKQAKQAWQLTAGTLQRAFTDELVASDSSIAKLIGKAAYVEAGGQIMADSFGDRGYWISRDIINQLLDARWTAQREAWLAEGWGWVASADEYSGSEYGYLNGTSSIYFGADGKFVAEQMAYAGIVYWPDGSRLERRGVVDPKRKAPPQTTTAEAPKKEASLDDPGETVLGDLCRRMTEAARAALLDDKMLVLQLLYARLASQKYDDVAAVGIRGATRKGDDVPSFAEALDVVRHWNTTQLVFGIAELVAPALRISHVGDTDHTHAIVRLLDPDGAAQFDAAEYFASVRKPIIALAWEEMTGGEKLKDGKKGDMATLAAAKANETGWMPPQLRGPRYQGPGQSFADIVDERAELQAQRKAVQREREAQWAAQHGDRQSDGDHVDDEEFVEDELAEMEAAE